MITKLKLVIFISIFILVALFLNGLRVHKSLMAEDALLKKQILDEQLKLEPTQTFFKLQKALQENNQKEIQSLTAPPFQQYVTNKLLIDDYKNAEVTEVVKGDENDYMVVIRKIHPGYTSGSSVRVKKINGLWKITNSPACDPLPHDCGDKYDSYKLEYPVPAPKNIIDEISLGVFGVIGGIFWLVSVFVMYFIRR